MPSSSRTREQAIERFWETVPPLWGLIRYHIREVATANFDITVEQFHVLRYVRRGITSVSEIATAKNISRPAMSQAVDLLVKKGLLTRIQSTEDRRYVDLALTKSGSDLLETVFDENHSWMKERMNILGSDELNIVIQAMEALKKMLD